MANLDAQETYLHDHSGFALELRDLVDSGPLPTQAYPPPYWVSGFGEGWWAARLLQQSHSEFGEGGTQFVLEGGFDQGQAAGVGLLANRVVRVGLRKHCDVLVYPSALSVYRYLRFVLSATQQLSTLAEINRLLLTERQHLRPEVPSQHNPAKFLAQQLNNGLPLWVASPQYPSLEQACQQTLARLGKSPSVCPPPSALEFVATLQAPSTWIGVVLGNPQPLLIEVLEQRVDETIELPEPQSPDPLARAVALWYRVAWASYYLALLKRQDPSDSLHLMELRELS